MPENAPGGGPYVAGFIGNQVGRLVTLGASIGWHEYVNGAGTLSYADCPPPLPVDAGCMRTRDAVKRALEIAGAIRVGPGVRVWRPFGMASLGYYRFDEYVTYLTYHPSGETLLSSLPTGPVTYTGVGGSLGVGLGYAPGGGRWSLVGSARVHSVIGDQYGDFGSNRWVEFGVGAGVRF